MHFNPWGFMDYKATKNLHSKIYFFYLRRQIMFEDFVGIQIELPVRIQPLSGDKV